MQHFVPCITGYSVIDEHIYTFAFSKTAKQLISERDFDQLKWANKKAILDILPDDILYIADSDCIDTIAWAYNSFRKYFMPRVYYRMAFNPSYDKIKFLKEIGKECYTHDMSIMLAANMNNFSLLQESYKAAGEYIYDVYIVDACVHTFISNYNKEAVLFLLDKHVSFHKESDLLHDNWILRLAKMEYYEILDVYLSDKPDYCRINLYAGFLHKRKLAKRLYVRYTVTCAKDEILLSLKYEINRAAHLKIRHTEWLIEEYKAISDGEI